MGSFLQTGSVGRVSWGAGAVFVEDSVDGCAIVIVGFHLTLRKRDLKNTLALVVAKGFEKFFTILI